MSGTHTWLWRLAKYWERQTKRAIMAIIMQSDKTLLIKALSDIKSRKLNDRRGYGDLV